MSKPLKCSKWTVTIFFTLAFLGALLWASSKDPYRRTEFALKTSSHGTVRGIVVQRKPICRRPVVVYLHGSGGSLLTSGTDLRQYAELGLASVCLEYNQADKSVCDEQLFALCDYIRHQPWALTNAVGWVGCSLGAQRMLSFALSHPDVQPQLLVRVSGGWSSELDSMSNPPLRCPVLILHGEKDTIFPVEESHKLAARLGASGIAVKEHILSGRSHTFDQDRALVTRLVAEYCRAILTPNQRFQGVEESANIPFLICLLPATGWGVFCLHCLWKATQSKLQKSKASVVFWEKCLYWLACILSTLAILATGARLLIPHFAATENTVAFARHFLLTPESIGDLDLLSANPIWRGKPLKSLLDHVEIANYDRNELLNWKVDDRIYNEYVLEPLIDGSSLELNWRRPLWESFYPRIRKEQTPDAAAEIVARYLRERVTITPRLEYTMAGVETAWKRGITDERGFEVMYVAALRSVGIGARLNSSGSAEFWTGSEWKNAPRPIASSFP